MHKAKDAWVELKKTRPPPGHDHVSTKNLFFFFFQPPIGFVLPEKKWQIVYLPLCLDLNRGIKDLWGGLTEHSCCQKRMLRDGFWLKL